MALQARGDHRNLVRFVESWAELGDPTPPARLAQARAFVELRLMDRASIRLTELTDQPEVKLDALRLAGRMYVLRGWPTKARKPLAQARAETPDDPELEALWKQAHEPARQPDATKEDGAVADQLALAEAYMATGAFLKAQAVLERVKRTSPDDARAGDLLWAIAGDFSVDAPLDELVARWGAEIELAEFDDEVEHTESLTAADAAVDAPDPSASSAFPALFRGPAHGRSAGDDHDDEVTQHSAMASPTDLQSGPGGASAEAPTTVDTHDDTQILMVIRREDGGGAPQPVSGAIHTQSPEATPDDFDLDAFRRTMGVQAPESDFDPGLEQEDDDLIVLTGKERQEGDRPEPPGSLPLDPDPTDSDAHPGLARRIRAETDPTTRTSAWSRLADPTAWWLLAIVGVLALGGAGLLGIGLLKLLLG